ncbi:MAG: hypothetical protein ACKO3P_22260, partial [Planctomycetaceae bacterium]
DMDDYVGYLKAPVGTWDGKTYRVSCDGDCHNFNSTSRTSGRETRLKNRSEPARQGGACVSG